MQGRSNASGIGRVEVYYRGIWGTICDDGWDIDDASVVCRQLGYAHAVRALEGSDVPHGSGKIWLDDIACVGNEENLLTCPKNEWGNHNCNHDEDAGVECSATGKN